jgi:hypothetical protein
MYKWREGRLSVVSPRLRYDLRSMPNDLVEFWRQAQSIKPPFAHPADLPVLRKHTRWIEDEAVDFESYLASSRFASCDDNGFHLSLLPVPYAGDLEGADFIILLLNPGVTYTDYWGETHVPEFRKRLLSNLNQQFNKTDYGFLYLDPQFCWHSGFVWWEKKFRELVQEIARLKFDGNYRDALRDFSHRVASVELIPYHSASFHEHKIINRLPSVAKVRAFVQDNLVPAARAGKKTLIVTRQATAWGLTAEKDKIVVYEGGHTRGASLSPRSEGGRAILRHYT